MDIGKVSRCQFSPDGNTLAVVVEVDRPAEKRPDAEKLVLLLDAATGKEIRRLPSRRFIDALAFSDDSRAVAVRDRKAVLVVEVASGGTRVEYSGQFRGGPLFSPDGRVLVTGGEEGAIQFWHADAAKPICSLTANPQYADSFAFSRDGKMLASAGYGNTAYVWDVFDVLRDKLPEPVKVSPKDLEALWVDLADEDAAKAFRAQVKLVSGATDSVPWLQDKAKAFPSTDLSRLDALVKDLDNDSFETRQKAAENIVTLGYWAGPAVRKALAGDLPSAEAKNILDKLRSPPPECLREIRTLEVLEQIGTPDAQKALEKLAEGSGPRQDEAKARFERLKRRGVK
jgi:hypothetical protein